MKKFVCAILSLLLIFSFIACGGHDTENVKYNLAVIGGEDLVKPLARSYKAGRRVRFYLPIVYDPDIEINVYIDETRLEGSNPKYSLDYSQCEYEFIMPAHDSILKIEYVDNFYAETIGTKVDFKVATGENILSCGDGSLESYKALILSLSEWNKAISHILYSDLKYDESFFVENALIVVAGSSSTMGHRLINVKIVKTEREQNKNDLTVKINIVEGAYQAISSGFIIIEIKKKDIGDCNLIVKISPDGFWD